MGPSVRSEPETRYVKSGDAHIAYQVVGDGPADLIVVRGYISHVEVAWESPALASFYLRLASFCRLILFDKRGTGLSDRVPEDRLPTLEQLAAIELNGREQAVRRLHDRETLHREPAGRKLRRTRHFFGSHGRRRQLRSSRASGRLRDCARRVRSATVAGLDAEGLAPPADRPEPSPPSPVTSGRG